MPRRRSYYDPFVQEPAPLELPLMVLERTGFYIHIDDAITVIEGMADRYTAAADEHGASVMRLLAASWREALELVKAETA